MCVNCLAECVCFEGPTSPDSVDSHFSACFPDSCFDIARQYTLDRKQFGAPLAAYVLLLGL
jgi:hypothetical protein